MVKRVYIEKKEGFDGEARHLQTELADFLGGQFPALAKLKGLRLLRRYDASHLDDKQFEEVTAAVFSEPQCDKVFYGAALPAGKNDRFLGIEYVPGQYDQRADSAEQCAELVTGVKPRIRCADFYIFESAEGGSFSTPLSDAALEAVKKYLINPVDSREALPGLPDSLDDEETIPKDVAVLSGFINSDKKALEGMARDFGLAMSVEDLLFCQDWFAKEGRDPTLAEVRVLDTYWSDHCRHTTFNTILEEINAEDGDLKRALELYEEARREVYGEKAKTRRKSLMDMATLGAKVLKKRGLASDVDESKEINACTLKVKAEFADGSSEPWLLLFKNETHNHPTEIEPSGGAATCLGGAIRDPLSGRAFVHQAMRITGGGDPRAALADTLPGKLPQLKIAREAAAGYSSYGNQIGLATGQVAEFYHPGFLAKRMELGAVIGAAPEAWVRREEPLPGDAVILVGGRTGRDGIGGATGSSKVHTGESVELSGAEVQKGNAVEERKLQRLFRKSEVSRLIKRCNDFGAGGVSVAVGELAAGLDINLDGVPKKYAGLDGTELAISESQERMAVVVASADIETFIALARAENLEAVIVAKVTAGEDREDEARLRMEWRGKTIVDLSRAFLNTNGAPRSARAALKRGTGKGGEKPAEIIPAGMLLDILERELTTLRSGSRRGLQERFDGSIGASSALFPWGGSEQGTPECGMAALLPSLGKQSRTASLMSFGYDPEVMSADPYTGAKGSIKEALAKFCCLGGDFRKARLSFQEYFERPTDPASWGRPAAALLAAFEAQIRLGIPAIGGKDSMSGNYRDNARGINLAVPPTLVAFAAGTAEAEKVRSGTLTGDTGNAVILLNCDIANCNTANIDEFDSFTANMDILSELASKGVLRAAYPVTAGGIAATLALMAFGNMTGVEAYAPVFKLVNSLNYQGSVLAEVDEATASKDEGRWVIAARTISEPVFRIVQESRPGDDSIDEENPESNAAECPLEILRRAYEYPLAQVYPQTSGGATAAEPSDEKAALELPKPKAGRVSHSASLHAPSKILGSPLAVLPVFPGTNCEWDMERAFREAGARVQQVVFRNHSPEDIKESIGDLRAAFGKAQIIAFSGGFSAGDEPDGSGKFIANVIRSPLIADALAEFLERREGLMLGICNGFQALIKTGLVPYGKILPADQSMPTLTFNTIGRHVSRMVRTKVMPSSSPWLSLEDTGSIHVIPISHGEGRVAIRPEEAEALFAQAQVPFCYADAYGNPTMTEPDNPNGSAFAIEGLSSPDGRILGKMGHSERCGEFVHINIPGNKRQRIFEAGVKYFT
ncbi:phosphoribosylformylglycinamidine synthase [Leadbettera azotonutricia]|uniref:Phosphoribosylformylglycinamidine synthase n=1 Tax=Leadbettera azotonutricia (strain ATCC BAA-888 / DSM 13862 / ZAS-9) TaxID=545695 RepID=F5YD23_LEAAZ|nr:phosphoribosylformylglycinamidine synthase [Leadbettera azotonutricia]AEF82993.1 phosphoribosylformylglycinamidine synthase [Leadbettera azotonutricia ZAS-9]